MPTYEYDCEACGAQYDIYMKISDKDAFKGSCEDCGGVLEQSFRTPISMNIPAHMRATQSAEYYGKQARIPLNLIDEKPDGSYRVTRIGQKKDIDND